MSAPRVVEAASGPSPQGSGGDKSAISGAGAAAGTAAKAAANAPPANTALSLKNVWGVPGWSGKGCEHLSAWLGSPTWKKDYGAVLRFVNSANFQKLGGKAVIQRDTTVCFKCHEGPLRRLFVSLHSPFVGCKEGGCMAAHVQETKHVLAMDMQLGEVYCFACKDIVYDQQVEEERAAVLHDFVLAHGHSSNGEGTPSKKARTDSDGISKYRVARHCLPRRPEWVPTPGQVQVLKDQTAKPEADTGVAGLRGLHNLGNTCFLNCVLQGLVNNPGVRDYFLGDYHNRHRCRLKREQAGHGGDHVCMGCEMDRLVDECFQGTKCAFSPHSFLFGMWKSSQNLAGYEQHDAHECFISVLDALQDACKNDLGSEGHGAVDHLQRLFRGVMRSDVTCLKCRKRSFTKDPFLDISLDLRGRAISTRSADPPVVVGASVQSEGREAEGRGPVGEGQKNNLGSEPPVAAKAEHALADGAASAGKGAPGDVAASTSMSPRSSGGGGGGGSVAAAAAAAAAAGDTSVGSQGKTSLEECLKRFTEVEKLDRCSLWRCEACDKEKPEGAGDDAGGEGIKQLSIQSVAPSLCVQLKRFESLRHAGGQSSSKIDTHVEFPMRLNMAPYCSTAVLRRGQEWLEEYSNKLGRSESAGHSGRAEGDVDESCDHASWYSLYAVVVHHGRMDSGHYSAYIRRGKDWFSCDDSSISLVSESEVLKCQAYLLYYISTEA